MNNTLQPYPNATYKRTADMQRAGLPLATWGSDQQRPVRARAKHNGRSEKLDQICGTGRKTKTKVGRAMSEHLQKTCRKETRAKTTAPKRTFLSPPKGERLKEPEHGSIEASCGERYSPRKAKLIKSVLGSTDPETTNQRVTKVESTSDTR